jgi:OHCU decarboxylase
MAITLDHLNTCAADEFIRLVGPVFESSQWIASAVTADRPFASRERLHAALCSVVRHATSEQQLALIRAHPDLAGRAVLGPESAREQAAAGLASVTPDEVALFDGYNTAYRARFGFPFIVCARKTPKDAILRSFATRLAHERDQEIAIALDQIFQIADLRLADMLP